MIDESALGRWFGDDLLSAAGAAGAAGAASAARRELAGEQRDKERSGQSVTAVTNKVRENPQSNVRLNNGQDSLRPGQGHGGRDG